MDETISSLHDSLAVGASAQTAKDRSDGSYRFVDAMQAARRQAQRDPGPPVELHLSESAMEYARRCARAGEPETERKQKRLAYPPRPRGTSEAPDTPVPDADRSPTDD
ncbi:MAG: hypothetical protein RBU25_13835 [Lentisphaeria bacterium]|jgi:hypothetical protein|nr:hypothetical protein [Lentisphaeria bacterium]